MRSTRLAGWLTGTRNEWLDIVRVKTYVGGRYTWNRIQFKFSGHGNLTVNSLSLVMNSFYMFYIARRRHPRLLLLLSCDDPAEETPHIHYIMSYMRRTGPPALDSQQSARTILNTKSVYKRATNPQPPAPHSLPQKHGHPILLHIQLHAQH